MTSAPRIHAVVFDMDGVIFDTEKLYFAAQDEVLKRRQLRFTPQLASEIMGMPGLVAMGHLQRTLGLDDPAQTLFDESIVLFEAMLETDLRLMDGAGELIDLAHARNLPVGLATSTTRPLALRMLGLYDLVRRFDAILTCNDVEHGKPHPEMYRKACERLRSDPSATLVVEDSVNGALAALSAGCYTVGVRHDHNQHVEFPPVAFVADSMKDVRLHALLSRPGTP